MEPITDVGELFGWIQSILTAMEIWETLVTVMTLSLISVGVKIMINVWSR